MKKRNAIIRSELFNHCSKNLSDTSPEIQGQFKCPISGELFGREAAENEKKLLVDIAHVYSEQCGCRLTTLLCKRCNSHLGSKYDNHIVQEHQLDQIFRGGKNELIRAGLTVNKKRLAVDFDWNNRNFIVKAKANSKDDVKAVSDFMRNAPADLAIGFDLRLPHGVRKQVSLLASGFLILFRTFGYDYLNHCETEWIRKILLNGQPPKDMPYNCVGTGDPPMELPKAKFWCKVGIAILPNRVKAWGVAMPSLIKARPVTLVIVPGVGNFSEYEGAASLNNDGNKHLHFRPLGDLGSRPVPYAGFMQEVWDEFAIKRK
jgi:hypothetical protein